MNYAVIHAVLSSAYNQGVSQKLWSYNIFPDKMQCSVLILLNLLALGMLRVPLFGLIFGHVPSEDLVIG